ncbi:hypothetical protein SIN8267_00151 [Sinobacterium norvegicum]|uniref:Uncharacterized protein n=1 Tax=Sinobacterium norvegicum TaxID=1641715 RepID=A0ABN8EEM5_9GAMM|nr:hypothetical protein [Sinobacterium norvegicum]CAH0990068.1 hypothetical protein SIN8267_00151 [Sinobacterium norvegicum]
MRKRLLTLLTLLCLTIIGSLFLLDQDQRQRLQSRFSTAIMPAIAPLLPAQRPPRTNEPAIMPSTPIYVEPIAIEPEPISQPLNLKLPANIDHVLNAALSEDAPYRLRNLFIKQERQQSVTISPELIFDEQEDEILNSIDGAKINFEFITD